MGSPAAPAVPPHRPVCAAPGGVHPCRTEPYSRCESPHPCRYPPLPQTLSFPGELSVIRARLAHRRSLGQPAPVPEGGIPDHRYRLSRSATFAPIRKAGHRVRTPVHSRPRTHRRGRKRQRQLRRQRSTRTAGRGVGIPANLVRRASQHELDRVLGHQRSHRPYRRPHESNQARIRWGDAAQPRAADHCRTVRHARDAAPGPHRPRLGSRAR